MSNWIAISKSNHLHSKWKAREGFEFASQDEVAPVYLGELTKLVPLYTLAFMKIEGRFKLVCLLGVGKGRNCYINSNDQWLGSYVPAHYRKYPFTLIKNNQEERLFCIQSQFISSDDKGSAMFLPDGNLAPVAQKVLDFLSMCESAEKQTDDACRVLYESDLLEPWDMTISTKSAGDIRIDGLYKINENKLQELNAVSLEQLNNQGALKLAYGQLFSVEQTAQLVERLEFLYKSEDATTTPAIDSLFEDNKTINFDAL